MKKLVLIAVLASIGGTAFAGNLPTTSSSNGGTNTQQQQAAATSTNAGNNQALSVTYTTPSETTATVAETVASNSKQVIQDQVSGGTTSTETLKNVPNVNAPALTSSNDTCMGSVSAGAGVVGVGASFGMTWTDKNCVMLKNSRELWNMGMRGAAMARMCMDKLNREALEVTGFVCPQSDNTKSKDKK